MTKEMIEKARACKSAEELLALAKENGIEMTAEEAAEKLAALSGEGELSDEELDGASGGSCDAAIMMNGDIEVGDLVEVCVRSIYLESCRGCGYGVFRVTDIAERRVYAVCAKCSRERSFPSSYNFTKVVTAL